MKKIINYLKKLNWTGAIFIVLLGMIAAFSNKNVINNENIINWECWLGIVLFFVLPLSLFPLIIGKKD